MRRRFAILSALLALLCLSSCTHKRLCMEHPHLKPLNLVFDWRNAPAADPDGMCVFFYNPDGTLVKRVDFNNIQGGQITLPVGVYRAVCYNNDTERVYFGYTDSYPLHSIFSPVADIFSPLGLTSKAGSVPRADSEERVVSCPDMIWGCSAQDIVVPEGDENRVIVLYPRPLVRHYTLTVRNCEGLKYAGQMCGSLYGMSPGIWMATETCFEDNATIPYECYKKDDTTIEAKFLTFGQNEAVCNPHRVVLYIWMSDGKIRCYGLDSDKFDLTDQVHNAPDPYDVYLEIDGLDLPTPITNGSGIAPSVDDWVEVEGDILM